LPHEILNKSRTLVESNWEAYRTLLYTIATSFGLRDKEAVEMVNEVISSAVREHVERGEGWTLKLWLSKCLVHNCVFRISSRMFSQPANGPANTTDNFLRPSALAKIPFSFRAVYILFTLIGFTEPEVGQLLNITPIQVRERMARAVAIMKSC
jgi:DNA-directed RNA polymerase specialized sigma24 family protein